MEQNQGMKDRDKQRHPGPMRFMRIESESAGILIAIGFVVLALVGLPIAKWFLLGAILVGGAVALLLRLTAKG